MSLKEHIGRLKFSERWPLRFFYRMVKPLWMLQRFVTDTRYRAAVITKARHGSAYHQQEVFTQEDRYPKVFAAVTAYLQDMTNPHLLSYGCSTGEEVASLGSYMPRASIVGADINDWCISQCRTTFTAPLFSFYTIHDPAFLAARGFDAVFCMAVFQHTGNRDRAHNAVARVFTFAQFAAAVAVLDGKLNAAGLLVIDNTDFNFEDTPTALRYMRLNCAQNRMTRKRPLFDSENRKIAEEQALYRIFVKLR